MKDELYKKRADKIKKFEFNEEVSRVFDDMIRRSVPGYAENTLMCADLIHALYKPGRVIYDLGCSTGTLALALAAAFQEDPFEYTGIDNSAAMVDKAAANTGSLPHHKTNFIMGDIREFQYERACVFTASYTLQFIPPLRRGEMVQKIASSLEPGGVFLMSEKVLETEKPITELFQKMHHLLKKKEGYSDIEISQKREAIEDVLVPLSTGENMQMLKDAGFSNVSIFLKKYNFASFIAFK